jgi:hypothetical protein
MNISTLEAFVEQENAHGSIFGRRPLSLLNVFDRQRIADRIDSQLSPENLSCDGELSRTETNRRYRNLTRCAEQLLSIDPAVKFYEYSE